MSNQLTDVERLWFRDRFVAYMAELRAEAFDEFFKRVLAYRYPGDFLPTVPWGRVGDLCCDGFRPSTHTIFAAYAPHEESDARVRSKMTSDLAGAREHWTGRFTEWTFVFASRRGIPAPAIQHLQNLRQFHPDLKLTILGRQDISRIVLRELSREDLIDLFGTPPGHGHVVVGAKEIADVLAHVSASTPSPAPIRPPPADKIEINRLCAESAVLLDNGRRRQHIVEEYFARRRDQEYGDKVARSFKDRYLELKNVFEDPDEILQELRAWVGGNERANDTAYSFAVLAVLMYFFERCDIFEEVPVTA